MAKRQRDRLSKTELRSCWELIKPWWVSEERWQARGLFLLVFLFDMALVGIGAWLSYWNKNFFNAFAAYDKGLVWKLMFEALLIALSGIIAEVSRTWFYQTLQIKWRKWLTDVYMKQWLNNAAFYRVESNHQIDNADQRIAEDIRDMTELALHLSLGFFSNLVKIVTFSMIIWSMSGTATIALFGLHINIPGYMLWVSIIYALVSSIVLEKWGKKIVEVEYEQQLRESDFRFQLMRIRENSAEIAISKGSDSEKQILENRFRKIEINWEAFKRYTRRITGFEKGYTEFGILLAYLMIIPRYFAHQIAIGSIMQLTMAFTNVRVGFAWFVFQYKRLTSLRSMARRLSELHFYLNLDVSHNITFSNSDDGTLRVKDLKMYLSDGKVVNQVDDLVIEPGSRWLIKGESGAGKTTFLKVLSGIWQYGTGEVCLPKGSMMFLPQEPYLPLGTLRLSLCYPEPPEKFPDEQCQRAMTQCELPQYADHLDDDDNTWYRKLSPGEKQRLAFARILLVRPDYLFMDEATSAMDTKLEQRLIQTLMMELPEMTIISVAHRQSLEQYHDNSLTI